MKESEVLGRKVVVKTWRKKGNGAIGGGRKNNSGKMGIIYQVSDQGEEELARCKGSTFKDLSRKLFDTGFIPRNVAISSSGETLF
jgi:DNA-binding PadR family transcriptional regulator